MYMWRFKCSLKISGYNVKNIVGPEQFGMQMLPAGEKDRVNVGQQSDGFIVNVHTVSMY